MYWPVSPSLRGTWHSLNCLLPRFTIAEAIPLFATSMLLPLLIVVLGVLQDTTKKPPHRLTPPESAQAVFHSMFSQVRPQMRR